MLDSYQFAVDVVQTIGNRLATKVTELSLLSGADASFSEWFVWEAFLACKQRQASYPFCEVMAKPTYASEGVPDDGTSGDLRIGGPDEGANHCWAFIEFILLDRAHDAHEATSRMLTAAVERLKRLGWKKSAALLLVLAINERGLATCEVLPQPIVTAPCVIALPNGGTAILNAFDCKRDPAHILTVASTQ
jgi:hypothetical protein